MIYIFVGIALFGLLMFVMSRSSNQSTTALTDQQASIAASDIIGYGRTVEASVQRLLAKGCSETQISFENTVSYSHTNPNAPSDKSCHVFSKLGGKINFRKAIGFFKQPWTTPADEWVKEFFFTADSAFSGIGKTCGSSSCSDLVMIVRVPPEVCLAINKNISINSAPNEVDIGSGTFFIGSFSYTNTNLNEVTSSILSGKSTGCLVETSYYNSYFFYKVLIAR